MVNLSRDITSCILKWKIDCLFCIFFSEKNNIVVKGRGFHHNSSARSKNMETLAPEDVDADSETNVSLGVTFHAFCFQYMDTWKRKLAWLF